MQGSYSTSLIDFSNPHSKTTDEMLILRYKVFQQRLNWNVNSKDGREIDQYDESRSLYLVTKNVEGKVVGCWRLRSSLDSYMLKDTFPCLLRGEQSPGDRTIWELSRFAVDSSNDGSLQYSAISSVTYNLIRSVYDFAQFMGIRRYVTVTTCSVQRLMSRVDIPMHRFGDRRSTKIDNIPSVACWIPINEEFRQAVQVPVPLFSVETDLVGQLAQFRAS